MSWRGFYVQSNNAIVVNSKDAADDYFKVFESYFSAESAGVGPPLATARVSTLRPRCSPGRKLLEGLGDVDDGGADDHDEQYRRSEKRRHPTPPQVRGRTSSVSPSTATTSTSVPTSTAAPTT